MRGLAILALLMVAGFAATAQDAPMPAAGPDVASAPGAVLRGLDKVSGQTTDLDLENGESGHFGTLDVVVSDCRFPVDDPAANAYAHLTIHDAARSDPVFDGWMIAATPALNALDHPRYDLWVLRCKSN